MRYQELSPISHSEFEARTSNGSSSERAHDTDFEYSDARVTSALDDEVEEVRYAAVLAVAHLARRHGRANSNTILRLKALAVELSLTGRVDDCLDDIAIFVKRIDE
jgi:hypothetical protein